MMAKQPKETRPDDAAAETPVDEGRFEEAVRRLLSTPPQHKPAKKPTRSKPRIKGNER